MRLDKLTTKSQEALQQAQALAEKRDHQAIDVEPSFCLAGPEGRGNFITLTEAGCSRDLAHGPTAKGP